MRFQSLFACAALTASFFAFAPGLCAQKSSQAGYQVPPQAVTDILTAAPSPTPQLSPNAQWMLLLEREAMPDISEIARRMLPLAGMRIDPAANAPFRTRFSHTVSLRATVPTPAGPSTVRVALPPGSKIANASWSHTSECFALEVVAEHGSQLWWVSVQTPDQPRLLTDRLNTVLNRPQWLPDGRQMLVSIWPDGRTTEPKAPSTPTGPNVQESEGQFSPTRTYQDLLANPHDEALFRYYATTQLVQLGPEIEMRSIGKPGLIASAQVSPNGAYLLVNQIEAPFSYLMPYRAFPQRTEVWNLEGKTLQTVAKIPMAENIPIGGVATGPRSIDWMASRDATLAWMEALDGGDPKKEVPHRDRLLSWEAPFEKPAQEVLRVEDRLWNLTYFSDAGRIATREYDRDLRWLRTLLHTIDGSGTNPVVLEDRSMRDRYGDPGSFLKVQDERGQSVVQQKGTFAFRAGSGASPDGDLPFLDRVDLRNGQSQRLWRCAPETYESAVAVIVQADEQRPYLITQFETKTSPPNLRMHNLDSNSVDPLTQFADPTPQVRRIKKQLVQYERADGVPLSATLYLPPDYQEGTRLPLLLWAYPREFNDAKTAGQVSGSEYRFTRMAGISHLVLATQGYAILDNATMPVIGDPETMNDTFVEQIVSSAQAAIDVAVEMGVADPNRVAVGGHSYGAFMTANLLAHCNLFRAGIARSGAYNRTLTPFGFQSERRPFWEAKEAYMDISPFMQADQIQTPLLLIHGEKDNNSGTYPIQSKRLYQAIKGNGGTVRLVMLPYESHGYRARQSVLHTQAEMLRWLDKYLKADSSAPVIEAGAPK